MITLTVKDNGRPVGAIDDSDFQFLMDQLEEESDADTDYYVGPETIDMLAANGASANLLAVLRDAVGSSEGVEVSWQKA